MNKNMMFEKYYKELNDNQREAVDAIDGPVMVVAGPGTGKTQVLTMRIANILMQTDTPPDGILALTFTDSGVRAMKDRLFSITGKSSYYVNINTFHSFASEVISSNRDIFLFDEDNRILTGLESVFFFREIIESGDYKILKPFGSKYYYVQTVADRIQKLKREGITPEDYKILIENDTKLEKDSLQKNLELYDIYLKYREKLSQTKRYDFEDMINIVVEKFETNEELLANYRERFLYFLADEFQDTNNSQAKLLYKLAEYWGQKANLFVVGDDDQSIYRFQGASVENIMNFIERYPNVNRISLNKNYRSHLNIIKTAETLIENNDERLTNKLKIDKTQISLNSNRSQGKIFHGEFSSSVMENHYIASRIKELINSGVHPDKIAIIYRNNNDSSEISDILARLNIKYTLVNGINILDSGIIIRLLHLFRVIDKMKAKDEDLDLFTLLNYEFLELNSLDILKLSRFATTKKINLFEAINHVEINASEFTDIDKLSKVFSDLIKWNNLFSNSMITDAIDTVINESGYLNWILKQTNSYNLLQILNSFLNEIYTLAKNEKNINLAKLLEYIDLMEQHSIKINQKSINIQENTIKLTTAHGSKGLEFEYVFIPKFIEKKWSNKINRDYLKLPSDIVKTIDYNDKNIRKQIDTEDDRRLFYVVLTRAKSEVYITSAKEYSNGGYSQKTNPSVLFHELPSEYISSIDVAQYEKQIVKILPDLFIKPERRNYTTETEASFLKEVLSNFKLSPSSLNLYLECPYKFKLDHLFKTPTAKERPLVLGSAVHYALLKLFSSLSSNVIIGIDELIAFLDEGLKKEILTDKIHNEILSEGALILKVYYEYYKEDFNYDNNKNLLLERRFGMGWSKPILDDNIMLQGIIDKVNISPDGKSAVITDYKTGNPKSRNEILGMTKKSDKSYYYQLLFYYLLIELDKDLNLDVEAVELDFIGTRNKQPKKESFSISNDEIIEFKKLIREVYASIKTLKFEKTSDYNNCENCRFRNHCWPDGIPAHISEQMSLMDL